MASADDKRPADAASDKEIAEERLGTVLKGKWTLERLIGLGGMAAVYAAVHEIGRKEAIKILHPDIAESSELVERFRREAHAANRFEHPGVVQIRDIDVTDDGSPFMVMELLEGEPLSRRIADGEELAVEEVLRIADEVLDVLVAAHAEEVIHRDIKPSNIFLEPDGRVRVLDFGVARIKHGPGKLVTELGTMLGTVAYMPAEQVKGVEVDERVDLYAVGATMFELLTGRRVHLSETEQQLAADILTKPAPPLGSLRDDVPEAVCLIVDRALAFAAARRYPNAAVMQADLHAARQGRTPLFARSKLDDGDDPRTLEPPESPADSAGDEGAGSTRPAAPGSKKKRKKKRSKGGKSPGDVTSERAAGGTVVMKDGGGEVQDTLSAAEDDLVEDDATTVKRDRGDTLIDDGGEGDATTVKRDRGGTLIDDGEADEPDDAGDDDAPDSSETETVPREAPGAAGAAPGAAQGEGEEERAGSAVSWLLLALVIVVAGIVYFSRSPAPAEKTSPASSDPAASAAAEGQPAEQGSAVAPSSEPSRSQITTAPEGEGGTAPSRPAASGSAAPDDSDGGAPASLPSGLPTALPSELPTALPSVIPSTLPTGLPSLLPTSLPTSLPSGLPPGWPTAPPPPPPPK